MPYLLVIVGLPGSGKTYEAKRLEKQIGKCTFFDDYSKNNIGFDALINSIKMSENVIITDPYLCISRNLDRLLEIFDENQGDNDYSCDIRYFNNDPEQCWINASNRDVTGEKETSGLIRYLSKQYNPPLGKYNSLKVWSES
jgi:hypothetical protein